MQLRRLFGIGYLARRLVRELGGLREGLAEQNRLLARLADQFAPIPPPAEDLARTTSADHLDDREMGVILAYIDRCRHDLGRDPSDDEILAYLADERTQDLQARLAEAAGAVRGARPSGSRR